MHSGNGEPTPPRGILRLVFRLPVPLFRSGLSRLLGNRLLLLTHVGRKTGQPRHTVLEVVRYDAARDSYFVVSAWGERADWLKNIRKTPDVTVCVGRRRAIGFAKPLPPSEGETELLDYVHRHPIAARALSRLIGYRVSGSDEEYRALARKLTVVSISCAREH